MQHVSSARPTGKFPEKEEKLKRWARFPGWNFRTECRVPFMFLVVCTGSRSMVGHRDVLGFTTKWNNFLPIGNSTSAPPKFPGFFPKWKAPTMTLNENSDIEVEIWISRWPRCINGWTGYFVFFNSIDIFTESILVLLSVLHSYEKRDVIFLFRPPPFFRMSILSR